MMNYIQSQTLNKSKSFVDQASVPNMSNSVVLPMQISTFVSPTGIAKKHMDSLFADAGMYRTPNRSQDIGELAQAAAWNHNKKPKAAHEWAKKMVSESFKLTD